MLERIVSLEVDEKKKLVASPSFDSFQKFLERSRQQAKYEDGPVMDSGELTKDVVAADLLTDKIT